MILEMGNVVGSESTTQCAFSLGTDRMEGSRISNKVPKNRMLQLELAQKMPRGTECITKRLAPCRSAADSILGGRPRAERHGSHHQISTRGFLRRLPQRWLTRVSLTVERNCQNLEKGGMSCTALAQALLPHPPSGPWFLRALRVRTGV